MYVFKRDGRKEPVAFDKITARINKLCYGLDPKYVNAVSVSQKVVAGVYDGVTTSKLDELAAETCAYNTTRHPDFAILAARIAMSNLHKNTEKCFSRVIEALHNYTHPETGRPAPLISDEVYNIIMENADALNSAIVYDRDNNYDYFGFKTLERSYLLRMHDRVAERPQHMIMRVAVCIHGRNLEKVIESYNLMSEGWFTHASPTLFNAGTPKPQLSSCFLIQMKEDSIEGIYDTLKTCALISKSAGGIGLAIHKIRASGSYISGTNGNSNGIVPMLRVFNNTARYVDQGGGKRKGAFAVYLEPWHADVFDFLDLKKNNGHEERRARDLFYALWIPDLFMQRVQANGVWSLMCPNECPGLPEAYGDDFKTLYEGYEAAGKFQKQVRAQELWFAILKAQVETGTPFMLYKDAANMKSNQKNLGTIQSSNLCTEIMEYTAPDEVAVCNLASIALPKFVKDGVYDFDKLVEVTKVVTRNLNRIIDINYYPVEEARNSNLRHRPIGIGVQGLADAFILMRYPFASPEAKALNRDIFEAIYYGACVASAELAEEEGPYSTFAGSPASMGTLQFDMWGVTPSDRFDWASLKAKIVKTGMRNSLLVAPMPTASTSQILGNNECIEPYTSNIYVRRVLSGEFQVVNNHLLRDLMDLGLWTPEIKNRIIARGGSVKDIEEIPQEIRDLYKTVWEISQRDLIDMAADRGAFIDQSQSFNVFLPQPTVSQLSSMHFYGWTKGLKTGQYYLRSRPAADAIQMTVEPAAVRAAVAAPTVAAAPANAPLARSSPAAVSTAPLVASPVVAAPATATNAKGKDEDMASVPLDSVVVLSAEDEKSMEGLMCSISNREACLSCGS